MQNEIFFFHIISFLNFSIAISLIYNFVLVSGIQQSDSVIYINMYIICILFHIVFHYKLLQSVEYNSVYTVGPSWLSILYIIVYI